MLAILRENLNLCERTPRSEPKTKESWRKSYLKKVYLVLSLVPHKLQSRPQVDSASPSEVQFS